MPVEETWMVAVEMPLSWNLFFHSIWHKCCRSSVQLWSHWLRYLFPWIFKKRKKNQHNHGKTLPNQISVSKLYLRNPDFEGEPITKPSTPALETKSIKAFATSVSSSTMALCCICVKKILVNHLEMQRSLGSCCRCFSKRVLDVSISAYIISSTQAP